MSNSKSLKSNTDPTQQLIKVNLTMLFADYQYQIGIISTELLELKIKFLINLLSSSRHHIFKGSPLRKIQISDAFYTVCHAFFTLSLQKIINFSNKISNLTIFPIKRTITPNYLLKPSTFRIWR